MENKYGYSKLQLVTLVLLRLIIGWQILYEGVAKLYTPNWSSAGFLRDSQWIMSDISQWIVSNNTVLSCVDFLNTWGLIAIGLGLMLGLFARTASIAGAFLLFIYYLNCAPIIGIEYTYLIDGNSLIINKILIESVALFALAVFPTSSIIGLDVLFIWFKNKKKK